MPGNGLDKDHFLDIAQIRSVDAQRILGWLEFWKKITGNQFAGL